MKKTVAATFLLTSFATGVLASCAPVDIAVAKPVAENRSITLVPTAAPKLVARTAYAECDGLTYGLRAEFGEIRKNSPDGVLNDTSFKVFAVENQVDRQLSGVSELVSGNFSSVKYVGLTCAGVSKGEMTMFLEGFTRPDAAAEKTMQLRLSKTGLVSRTIQ